MKFAKSHPGYIKYMDYLPCEKGKEVTDKIIYGQ